MDTKGLVENATQREEMSSTSSAMSKTTTISTIAVQSGKTRIVIALLHCGDWINLKILEITPELTSLGNTLAEALELQKAHDDVLRQLQNKQSPVEELLRQADQLIATQKPRAEVYAAMAESLGRAWKDINSNLELRKHILDLNVLYHTKAQEFFNKMGILESSCRDTVVPIEMEAVKEFLTNIHDQRRALLESLMGALQAGNSLLAKLKELGAEGTLDSRPEHIRKSVEKARSQVQGWLDELHVKRQNIETTFNKRKMQLEQCLALAILAADLRELEETVQNRRELLASSNQYGDSSASAELFLHEHKKSLPEAQQLQERALKITKATEQLEASGSFAAEQATAQSYIVLSATSDYLTDLQNRESLLERVIAFFRSAQTVVTKLDQLEIQLTATELPKTSPQLAQLHEQCFRAIEDATAAPIAEGYAILDVTGSDTMGTEGIRRMVEELENKKILLHNLCTAHREDNMRINTALNNFLERHNEIYTWLVTIAEAFLQGHQDMGSDSRMSKDFFDLHNQLLTDLQMKGNEINALLLTLPPILEFLEDTQRTDVDIKVEQLHERWMKLKNILENRMELTRIYVKFHVEADIVNKEMDKLDSLISQNEDKIDEEIMKNIEERFESIVPLYQCAKNTGLTFINEAQLVSEPHLDTKRACLCVESVLERLSGRQLVVTRNWQTFQTNVVEKREILCRLEQTMVESTKTITWVSNLDSQLYPVITISTTKPKELADHIEKKLTTFLPDIRKAQVEVDQRIKMAESLISRAPKEEGEKTHNIIQKLQDLHQRLSEISSEYQILLQVLIGYFRNLEEIDVKADNLNVEVNRSYPWDLSSIEAVFRDHESSRLTILERLRFAQTECDQLSERIRKQEPELAAEKDIDKLQHVLELQRVEFENQWRKWQDSFESQKEICIFDNSLKEINENIDNLDEKLRNLQGHYGESVSSAKAISQTFKNVEKTVEMLGQRINTFIDSGEKLLAEHHTQSPHIQSQLSDLKRRWENLNYQVKKTRSVLDLSVTYFELLEKANEWFREGSKLLVTIARKATTVKRPEEAEDLLSEISKFLKPGEEKQEERIKQISELGIQIDSSDEAKHAPLIYDNREMLESFSSITKELSTLADNLRRTEEETQRAERQKKEAQLAEEIKNLERARQEEEARRIEERRIAEERKLVQEKIRMEELRLAEEKRRIEEARQAEASRLAEERRQAAELKRLEEARMADERRKLEEEKKQLELDKAVEDARRAEEAKKALRLIEEAKLAEERIQSEIAKRAEEVRLAEERRKAEEARMAEQAELAEQRLRAEELRIIEEKRKLDALRFADEMRLTEEKKKAEEIKLNEEARLAEERRKLVEEREELERTKLAEEIRRADEARLAEEARRREAEERKLTEEAKAAEIRRGQEEEQAKLRQTVEITEITDVQRIEVQKSSIKRVPSPLPIVEDAMEPPVFISPLSDATIQEGSKFTFVCHVIGHPAPTITWYKAGISIQSNPDYHTDFDRGLCSLTIEETFAEDSARYTCRAVNSAGEDETTALLSVKEIEPEEVLTAPLFTRHLQPAVVKEGSTFQFECKVEGNPLPSVQWFKNTECIDNSPDYIITFNNGEAVLKFEKVYLDDKADYTCKAFNQSGIAQSTANLTVTPLEPTESPVFVSPLSNVMARAGQKIKLECEVIGLPKPNLTWSHNDKPLKETREIKLQHEDNKVTLIVNEAFPKDAGTYSITAKNIAGEATSSCNVSVKGRLPTETSDSEIASDMEPIKPSIQLPLANTTIPEGNRVRLDCVIVGQPEPEVIWYHDGRPVKESSDIQLLFQGDRCSLIIQEALAEDAGEYKVIALNSAGEASSQCLLTVAPLTEVGAETKPHGTPPKFSKLPSDVLISEGDEVVLEGVVIGEPRPEIKWLLNNFPITDTHHFVSTHDAEGNVKLEIKSARPEDKGVYTIKAANSLGEAKCFAQLIVKSFKPPDTVKFEEKTQAPVFKELFYDRAAFEETSTKFECIVVGKPTPKVTWLFNGDAISGKDFLVSTSGERQVLSIPNLKKEHSGTITCVAENEVGKASCAASLTVQSTTSILLPELRATELPSFKIPTQMPLISPLSSLRTETSQQVESSYSFNREVRTHTSTSQSTSITSSEPHVEEHKIISQNAQTFKQVNQGAPEIKESHKIEEFHRVGKEPPVFHEKSSTIYTVGETQAVQKPISSSQQETIHKLPVKVRPAKFVTPLVGKIVDQDVDVVLEGILDGSPTPRVSWTKNEKEIKSSERVEIEWKLNRASLKIKNVTTEDAGRYSCTAVNDGGTAVSTADLVVRKTIFPPVFGRRLQAQVLKKGDRVKMEVEITGTPEPTVTWYKDGVPVESCLKGYNIKSMGQCHTLVIEKAELDLTGRFMVKAVNCGGEAQSIADIAVFEPTPDTMIEVVKTVVFEDVRKHETLTSAADTISSSISTPKSVGIEPPKVDTPLPSITSHQKMSKSLLASSEIISNREQQVSQDTERIVLEHKVPDILMPKVIETSVPKEMAPEISERPGTVECTEEKTVSLQEGIETSSISKQSSLQFFVKKIKEGETPTPVPSDVKKKDVYEKFDSSERVATKETKIPILLEEPIPPKPEASEIFSKDISFHHYASDHKPIPMVQQTVQSERYQTFSSTQKMPQPEPPAEIFYTPPPSDTVTKMHGVSERIRLLSESHKDLPSEKLPFTTKPTNDQLGQSQEFSYIHTTDESFQRSSFESSLYESEIVKGHKPLFEEKPIQIDSHFSAIGRQTSAQSAPGEPSSEGLLMEKQWAHKFKETNVEKSWPPSQHEEPKMQPSWSVHSTLEKKWAPSEVQKQEITQTSKVVMEQIPKQHYIAEVSNLGCIVDRQEIAVDSQVQQMSESEKIVKHIATEPQKQYVPIIDSLPIRPVSVQDITDEVYLEPGPPPEMAYAQPPRERRQSYVETIEHELEKNLEPSRVPPCAIRTIPPPKEWIIPPPLPPKQALTQAPPLPAKPLKHFETPKTITSSQTTTLKKFSESESFQQQQTKLHKVGLSPTPSKFIKGKFTDSDYESDFEFVKIPPKWKPSSSDTEEPTYRKVKPPKLVHFGRSISQEREPLPPSQFDNPPRFEGPPRPELKMQDTKDSKRLPAPVYAEFAKKSDASKVKKIVDGYMADTDEPFKQQTSSTTEYSIQGEYEYKQFSKSKDASVEIHKVPKFKKHPVAAEIPSKELIATPIIISHTTEKISEQHEEQASKLKPFPFKPDPSKPKKAKCPPPPSPSRFVKGEFQESEYESDYEGKIPPVWNSDMEHTYKPVRPVLTPTQQQPKQYEKTPTPPIQFDNPPPMEGPPRPKFEPIEKFKPQSKPLTKPVVHRPKPISAAPTEAVAKPIFLQPGTPPEMGYAPGPKKVQYYKSTVSAPYTNAIQTETSNVMHFNESTESCSRTMSLQQTHKVIKFGDQHQKTQKLQPFPFQPEPEKPRRSSSVPPPPTPTKFHPGEFRESDYESDVENAKIMPKWSPGGGNVGDLQYRRVRAPAATRSSSVPAPRERVVPPMEFHTQDALDGECKTHESVYKKFMGNQSHQLVKRNQFQELDLHPGSPPEYKYATDQKISKTATKIATHHMDSMTQAFKSKTQKFVTNILEDVNKKKVPPKPILKNGTDDGTHVYREESRAAQYGTKHVDPDTGLIYFKYDFGYEFGIVLPGASKEGGEIPHPKQNITERPKRTVDIEMPVYHEKSVPNTSTQLKPKLISPHKSAKWEPTSESEMSEYEGETKKTSHLLQGPRWEASSCSPASLSPSLPSTSPAFNHSFAGAERKGVETPPSCPSTPAKGSLQQGNARAPLFITPLRDIAVLSGQVAKFECIVQSEPAPNILWSKNGRIIENSIDQQQYYRNGVCRLTISQTYPEDAGTYSCTATNTAGTANTTATLQVSGERRSQYIK